MMADFFLKDTLIVTKPVIGLRSKSL